MPFRQQQQQQQSSMKLVLWFSFLTTVVVVVKSVFGVWVAAGMISRMPISSSSSRCLNVTFGRGRSHGSIVEDVKQSVIGMVIRQPQRQQCIIQKRPRNSGWWFPSMMVQAYSVPFTGRLSFPMQNRFLSSSFITTQQHTRSTPWWSQSSSVVSLYSTKSKKTTAAASAASKAQMTVAKRKNPSVVSATGRQRNNNNKNSNNNKHILVIVESPAKCATLQKLLSKIVGGTDNNNNNNIQFTVLSCYGHVRDLTRQKFPTETFPYPVLGIDLDHQYRPQYDILPHRKETVQTLRAAAKNADCIWIATDPDREGEGIAWHVLQVLTTNTTTESSKPYRRIRFSEITETAVRNAIPPIDDDDDVLNSHSCNDTTIESSSTTTTSSPREISKQFEISPSLVAAQETRRILDRLAGFTVSPILWKKIGIHALSAGRVQSVGLARIVQREIDICHFQSTQYYTLRANVSTTIQSSSDKVTTSMEAKLYSINGQSVANARSDFTSRGCQLVESSRHKLHLSSIEMAEQWVHKFINTTQEDICITWKVTSVETKPRTTSPPVPFKTSTLQMEASSKLGWSISRTMRVAQELYESGCISYMRTDNVQLSPEAKQAASQAVIARFGTEHVATNSSSTTTHRTTSKKQKQKKNQNSQFAQEAHEAIRPSILENGTFRTPKEVESTVPNLSSSAVLLYKLIYQRTLAHRMHPRITNHTSVMIEGRRRTINSNSVDDDVLQFRATGFVVVYPGYSLAYNEDDNGNDSSSQKLPKNLAAGQALDLQELAPLQHTTQPPPRFTEATLVKELESLGVGRPSTYASVIQLLRDRAYVMSKTPFGEAYQPPRHMSIAAGSISAVRAAGGEVVFAGGAGGSKSGPLIPSLTAFVVCDLLQKHCPTYIDPTFTASMEDRLDRIARGDESLSGEEQRIAYLSEFYAGEHGLAAQIKRIDETVDPYKARRANLPSLLDKDDDGSNSDSQQPAVGVFVGPWGPYIRWMPKNDDGNATTIPTDNENEDVKRHSVQLPAELAADIPSIKSSALRALLSTKEVGGDVLGAHPEDGRSIRLKTGRFGAYLQWGDDGAEGTTTHSLPRNRATMRKQNDEATSHEERSLGSMLGITLEEAIGYVSLPRTVGTLHGLPITCALGPYGPYLKYNSTYTSLSENDGDVLSIDEETAMKIVTERIIETTKTGLGRGVVANLGEKEDGNVVVKSGRFGKFLNWKNVNVKLPSEYLDNPEEIPLEVAWSLIQVRGKKSGSTTGKKRKQHVLSKAVDIPAPPKRPLSAYLHFCATNRPAVAANSTKSLTAPELSKTLASLWAELNSEERAVYNEMAAKSRDDYDNQRKRWEEEYSNINGNKKNKKTFQNGEIRPKKSKSAYLFFCAAKRPEVAETVKTLGEISKELARRWAETEDRTEYEEMAAADKRRYEEECTALKSSAKTKGTKDNESSASTPRAPSAYMLFCREMRPSIVDEHGEKLPFADTTKKLAMMWKECSEDTRERFHNLAKQGKMETSGPPMG